MEPGPRPIVRVVFSALVLAPGGSLPRPIPLGTVQLAILACAALLAAGGFALVRTALLRSVPSRVLELARSEARRKKLRPLLERAELLATCASIYQITSQFLFVVFVWVLLGLMLDGEGLSLASMGLALLVTVPLLVLAGEVVPGLLRGERSDRLLATLLPAFELFQRPLAALIFGLEATRRGVMRLFRIPDQPSSTRQIVEGLRAVIEDSEREKDLADSEREIIENALGIYADDAAEVMTPRTEINAVEIDEGVPAVVSVIAETGHTRIPVYDQNLDTIVGVAYAQEIIQALARGGLERAELRSLLRSVPFVPETKLVSELLAEFRRDHQKIAIVLDEYGGTAGLVTIGDIVSELVGEMPGELGRSEPEPIRRLSDGRIEVQGTTRVSEVNAELELELPEDEDFETLAGFVLSEFGRFPRTGETFEKDGVEFAVAEASDRRVLRVHLRLAEAQRSA